MSAREPSATAKKERQVLELRRMGLTYDEIAERVGYANKGSAHKAWKRAMERAGTRDLPLSERYALELDRLERLHAAVWTKAARGDLSAVREAKRLSDARVRLLSVAAGAQVPFDAHDDDSDSDSATIVSAKRLAELREQKERRAAERSSRG